MNPVPKPPRKPKKAAKPIKRKARIKKRGGDRFKGKRNEAFREWVRGLPCALAGCVIQRGDESHCAHVKTRGAGGGDVGNCLPLCPAHHRSQHDMGIKSFEQWQHVDLAKRAQDYAARWLREQEAT